MKWGKLARNASSTDAEQRRADWDDYIHIEEKTEGARTLQDYWNSWKYLASRSAPRPASPRRNSLYVERSHGPAVAQRLELGRHLPHNQRVQL